MNSYVLLRSTIGTSHVKFGLGTYSSVELGQRGIKTQVAFKYITEGACNPASEMHKHMTAMSRTEQRNCVLLFLS